MRAASDEFGWNLNYGSIAMIFRGGSIILAGFLQNIKDAYDRDPELKNLFLDDYFSGIFCGWCQLRWYYPNYQAAWRKVVASPSLTASRFRLSLPIWTIMTAIGRKNFRRTCCKRSVITSARIRLSALTAKALSTSSGWIVTSKKRKVTLSRIRLRVTFFCKI
jgi:6-phosphogluconate dehydrogenase